MPDPTSLHSDPLSDLARKERRNLLVACVVGFLVSDVGLAPQRIALPGLEFPMPSQKAFMALVEVILFYFLLAFVVYGTSDFFAWRKRYQDYLEEVEQLGQNWSEEDQEAYDELHINVPRATWLYERASMVAKWRLLFEFLLPVLAGVVESGLLLRHWF